MPVTAQRDLVSLALAPSQTEREKAERTHNMIRDHLESDERLRRYSVSTYLQGSYKNSTNVRGDSDIDMGSLSDQTFFYDLSELPEKPETNSVYASQKSLREQVIESISDASYSYSEYRADVLASLSGEYDGVVNGNKAIRIPGNTYRLDADVLPCIGLRWYYKNYLGRPAYHQGIAFETLGGKRIINFPHQHFENLGEKDRRCDNKVKGCIRIMKRLRNELEEAGQWDRKRSPSFYLESLVWNAPDNKFDGPYPVVLQNVVAHLYNDLREKRGTEQLRSYLQVSETLELIDGGYCANNPTLYAIADATHAMQMTHEQLRVVSIGVGEYPKPDAKTWKMWAVEKFIISAELLPKTLEINTKSMEQLRTILFQDIATVRINDTFSKPEMATDFMEHDLDKLSVLWQEGRESFGRQEQEIKECILQE